MMEEHSVFHLEFRSAFYYFGLQLELYYTYSLVHLCYHAQCLVAVLCVILFWIELGAWIVSVRFHCECSERKQVDAVSVF